MSPIARAADADPAVLLAEGPDAAAFLHGQVTADVLGLGAGQATLAALCSPQGRVVAVLRIGRLAAGHVLLLPAELAGPVLARLRRYLLRSRVTLSDATGQLAARPVGAGSHAVPPGSEPLRLGGDRCLAVGPATGPAPAAGDGFGPGWEACCVALGEPEVYAATGEAWVPQMLNLDLIGAVSFAKGCYTGQEVVARLQHLGRIKRRMFRYRWSGAGPPAAGSTLLAGAVEAGRVVRTAGSGHRGELLAVIALDFAGATLTNAAQDISCEPVPLPYEVPEARTR